MRFYSGSQFNTTKNQSSMLPPRRLETSLSLVEYQSESAGSRGTWPAANPFSGTDLQKERERGNGFSGKTSLLEVVRDKVDVTAERMQNLPDKYLDGLKNELLSFLEGSGGSQPSDEFLLLQKLVRSRVDLTERALTAAHRAQLEILVAVKTGIQAFLHPSVGLSRASLINIFLHRRCRNIACGCALPAEDCTCRLCSEGNGFCSLCMCMVCSKFDFEVNTCRWIGCESCSHWAHADCAIQEGMISSSSPRITDRSGSAGMVFRCWACNRSSDLVGWVKDVFQQCGTGWDRDVMIRELNFVRRIFHRSEDPRGRKLFRKCEELMGKLKSGVSEALACKVFLMFFQELETDPLKNQDSEDSGKATSPHEAFNKIFDVVHESVEKMNVVADDKMRMVKRARRALESCDEELKDKAREITTLTMERQRKKIQVDELESMVRLKQAEADMFELKANESRREVQRLQRIALAKMEKSEEEDYTSRYLKQRLNEAEAEKRFLFEKIKLQDGLKPAEGGAGISDSSHSMYNKIQDLLKNYV